MKRQHFRAPYKLKKYHITHLEPLSAVLAFALELPPLDPVVLDGGLLAVLPDALAEGLPARLALVRRVRPAGHAFQTTWREKRGVKVSYISKFSSIGASTEIIFGRSLASRE